MGKNKNRKTPSEKQIKELRKKAIDRKDSTPTLVITTTEYDSEQEYRLDRLGM